MVNATQAAPHRTARTIVGLALLLSAAACGRERPATATATAGHALFTNGSFEDGTFGGWTSSTNLNRGITYPPASIGDLLLQGGGTARSFVRAGATESQVPAGMTAASSVRFPKFGTSTAVLNELGNNRNVNAIKQSYTAGPADVDPADGKIHVRFALAPVLENPSHADNQQPYFYVQLRNVTKGTVLFATFNFSNQPGVPWKIDPGTLGTGIPVTYTDWRGFDVAPGNAALQIGDTVEIQVIAAGCSLGGHFGEVYVDGFGAFFPGLSVAASVAQQANAGTDLTYAFLVKNGSTLLMPNVVVNETLPAGTTFVSLSAPGATCTAPAVGSAGTVSCSFGWVNPSASTSFTLTVHVDPAATGKISNGNYEIHADSVSPLYGPLVETALTTGVAYADLAVSATDGVGAVTWGQPLGYTIVVTNHGPSAVTGAVVRDTWPAQVTGASATWTCSGAGGGACGSASGTGSIDTTADLPVDGSVTYVVHTAVVAGSGTGTLNNVATVTAPAGFADPDSTNNAAADLDGIGSLVALSIAKGGDGLGAVISSPSGISCGASCTSASASFVDGSLVSLTAVAHPGSTFTGWGGACAAAGTAATCNVTLAGAASVSASFTSPQQAITGSSAGNGTVLCTPAAVPLGGSSTCALSPDPGYQLTSLTDNGSSVLGQVSGGQYALSDVQGPHALAATFLLSRGGVCGAAEECVTGLCVDGVCCDGACGGSCQSCALPGTAGTCTTVAGTPPPGRTCNGFLCGPGGSCNGSCASDSGCVAADWCVASACVPRAVRVVATAPSQVNPGGDLTYTLVVENGGSSPASATTVSDVLPQGTTLVSLLAPAATCARPDLGAAGTVACDFGTLAPGASSTMALTVHVDPAASGTIVNGAYGVTAAGQAALSGAAVSTTVTSAPLADLAVSVQSGLAGASLGQPVTYQVVVSNAGPAAVLGATVAETLSPSLGSVTWSCTAGAGGSCGAASGSGPLATTADLPAGGIVTYTVTGTVGPGGPLTNTVAVSPPAGVTDPTPVNDVAAETTPVGALVALTVTKGGSADGSVTSSPGGLACAAASCRGTTTAFVGGSTVTLTAVPLDSAAQVVWSGGPCDGSTGPTCTVTLNGPVDVTATFAAPGPAPSFSVSTSSSGGGTLTCLPASAALGATVTCTAAPSPGYQLALLDDDGSTVTTQAVGGQYRIAVLQRDHLVAATFAPLPPQPNGTSCVADVQCGSGSCVDGFCCNGACAGQCQACDLPGQQGTCAPASGAPRGARPACTGAGTACGGSCDGVQGLSCSYPGAATPCRGASCTAGTATLAAACDGAGHCPALQTVSCAPFTCGAAACAGNCTADGDCTAGNYCAAGVCAPRLAPGTACGASSQCATGACVDGVCCDQACDGQCQACDVAGQVGTCTTVRGAPHGARTACAGGASACGGSCDGTSATACAFPGAEVACRPASCSGGTQAAAATCDGAGACPAPVTRACGDYACGADSCNTGCRGDADCAPGAGCSSGSCVPTALAVAWKVRGSGCSSAGAAGLWPLAALLLLPLLRRRRGAAAAVLLLCGAARAQTLPSDASFSAERFAPGAGAHDLLGIQSPLVNSSRAWQAGAWLSYADHPLRLLSSPGDQEVVLLRHQSTLLVTASLGLAERFELGLGLPVVFSQSSGRAGMVGTSLQDGVAASGVGDLRLLPKVRLASFGPVTLGAALTVTLPTGRRSAFVAQDGFTGEARALAEWQGRSTLRVLGNLGVVMRGQRELVDLKVGPALAYGLAAEQPFRALGLRLAGLLQLAGEAGLRGSGAPEVPLELLAALRWFSPLGLTVTAGAGPGLSQGYGTPRYRLFAGVAFTPPPRPVEVAEAPLERAPEPSRPAPPPPPPSPPSPSAFPAAAEPPAALPPAALPPAALPPAPLPPAPVLDRQARRIVVLEPVRFETRSDKLLPRSNAVLDGVAQVLREHPEIVRLRVEGHTDARGPAAYNLELSRRRAAAVSDYLASGGVDAARLTSRGYGKDRPLGENQTDAGRALNRRVEFVILESRE